MQRQHTRARPILSTSSRARTRRLPRDWKMRAAALVVICAGAAIILAPFIWLITTSLKTEQDIASSHVLIPNPPQFHNYVDAWTSAPFTQYFANTMIIEGGVITGTVLSCSLAAYGLARLRFPGRNIIFGLLLVPLMLPGIVTTIPLYIEFNAVGWLNTFLPLIVPSFFGNAFFIFLLRQFMLTLPRELEDAGVIDGAGRLRIWWSLILPLTRPALAAVVVLQFVATWNDFFNPLIYLNSPDKQTLSLALAGFVGQHSIAWGQLMAMSAMLMAPPALLFFLTQRYFISGIVTSGLAGR